ncbi:MAG: glycerol-3-phosphate 1-O-acyltransferase PlsB [Rhodocyclaceae bacterium]|nr:glycerol-3-phosphate 1-O-acyltransferase PlsB [Rhodocyclaceae bacterium]
MFASHLDRVATRMLYAWIRPRLFPEHPGELGLDTARPVWYVLELPRRSNLLVLREETRRAGLPAGDGYFFLNRVTTLVESARERHRHPPMLERIVNASVEDAGHDVQLVPVTILWGRAPRGQQSLLKALFSETWGPTGHFRQLMAILVHGRDAVVRFAPPISTRQLLGTEPDATRAVRKLARVLRVHFRRQRELAIGPDLSHRNTQVERLLAAPTVRKAIADEAATRGITHAEAHRRAWRCALEIPSDYSYGVARAFELFLEWLWNRLYDGIEIRGIDALDGIEPGSGIIYLPCHRSHIDYLLLSFIIYRHGLTPPHVAAGINLNLPLVGPLLRRGGAFFIRRSFKGEPLYAAVFKEYLHLMISRGFPVEYFIEGTRSRTGRMLPPRTGMLAMTLGSYLRDYGRPLVLVPVYIGYEKLLEGHSFVEELAGQPKRKESLRGLLATVRSLRREFGKVHVGFGRPLSLAEYLDSEHPGWRNESAEGAGSWLNATTSGVAHELARRINEAAVVNPVNLIALIMLVAPDGATDTTTVRRMIEHYRALLRAAPYSSMMAFCDVAAEEIIGHAIRLGAIERAAGGERLCVPAGDETLLAYFRNNVLHLVALPSLLACLLVMEPCLALERAVAAIRRLLVLAREELFMNCTPEEVSGGVDTVLNVLAGRELIRRREGDLLAPPPGSREHAELSMLAETMRVALGSSLLKVALAPDAGADGFSVPSTTNPSASPRG